MSHPGDVVHGMRSDDIYTYFVSRIDKSHDIISAMLYWLPKWRSVAGDRRFERMLNRMMTSPWPTLANRIKITNILVKGGISPDLEDYDNRTLLMLTSEPRLAECILQAGADPDLRSRQGCTALMMASQPKMVKTLMKHGADPDLKDDEGYTALMWMAATYPDFNLLNSLVSRGANIHLRNNKGRTALFLALKHFWKHPEKFNVNVLIILGAFTVYPERTCLIQMIARSVVDISNFEALSHIAALVKAGCVPLDADIDDFNIICGIGCDVERQFSRNISPLYVALYCNNWVMARMFQRGSFFTPSDFSIALDDDLRYRLRGSQCEELFYELPPRPFPLKMSITERFSEIIEPEQDRDVRVKELETTQDVQYDLLYTGIVDYFRAYENRVYPNVKK